MDIRALVREERERQGRKLTEVARAANVDPAHLTRFERGLRGMESEPLARVLAALEIKLTPEGARLDAEGRVVVPDDATDGGPLVDEPSPIDLTPQPDRRRSLDAGPDSSAA